MGSTQPRATTCRKADLLFQLGHEGFDCWLRFRALGIGRYRALVLEDAPRKGDTTGQQPAISIRYSDPRERDSNSHASGNIAHTII